MRLDVEGRSVHSLVPVAAVAGGAVAPLPDAVPDTVVSLVFDADPSNIRLARLVASGLMVERRFTVDEIEDLRIAVDEVCSVIVAHLEADAIGSDAGRGGGEAPAARVALVFDADATAITVTAASTLPGGRRDDSRADAAGEAPLSLDPLTTVILEATVDEHRIEFLEGRLHVSLRKAREVGPVWDGGDTEVLR